MIFQILADVAQSDHDLLITLNAKVDVIVKMLDNHLHHHFLYNIALFTALLAVIFPLGIRILKKVFIKNK